MNDHVIPPDISYLPLHLSTVPVDICGTGNISRQQAHRQRATIRAMARKLLAEYGYDGVHVRDLAKRCGVATQTLYNHLGGREEILLSAVDELLHVQISRSHSVSVATGRNFVLVYCDLTVKLLEADWRYVMAIIAILSQKQNEGQRLLLANKIEQRSIAAYQASLEALRYSGMLKPWVNCNSLATALQDSIRSALVERLRNSTDVNKLRYELMMNVGLMLLGATCGDEAKRIEAILEHTAL